MMQQRWMRRLWCLFNPCDVGLEDSTRRLRLEDITSVGDQKAPRPLSAVTNPDSLANTLKKRILGHSYYPYGGMFSSCLKEKKTFGKLFWNFTNFCGPRDYQGGEHLCSRQLGHQLCPSLFKIAHSSCKPSEHICSGSFLKRFWWDILLLHL